MKKIKLLISIIFLIVIVLNSNNIVKAALNITKIEITQEPTKTKYKVGESFDKAGMEITATYSDGSQEIITDYKIADGENLEAGQKQVLIHYTEGDREIEAFQKIVVTQIDNTITQNSKLPNAGICYGTTIVALILVLVSIYIAIKHK